MAITREKITLTKFNNAEAEYYPATTTDGILNNTYTSPFITKTNENAKLAIDANGDIWYNSTPDLSSTYLPLSGGTVTGTIRLTNGGQSTAPLEFPALKNLEHPVMGSWDENNFVIFRGNDLHASNKQSASLAVGATGLGLYWNAELLATQNWVTGKNYLVTSTAESTYLKIPEKPYVNADYVDTKISSLVNSAPESLDTLKELADALGNDKNFATTVTNSIAEKLGKTETAANSALLENATKQQIIDAARSGLQISGNYVTIDTEQTITGQKTFAAPTNIDKQEQTTVWFNTANGGRIGFGKEGPNSGTGIFFDQKSGTRRLNFRGTSVPGAIVWSQPETNSTLYFDVKKIHFRGCGDWWGNNEGIKPNNNNTLSIGTVNYKWKEAHITTIYENGESLTNKYALKTELAAKLGKTEKAADSFLLEGSSKQNIIDTARANLVTTNTVQTITEQKTFEKGIILKDGSQANTGKLLFNATENCIDFVF